MTRARTLATCLGLLAAFGCLSVLREKTPFPTSVFGIDSGVSMPAFDVQLLLMLAGIMLLQVVPRRHARAVVMAEGCACLAAYGAAGGVFALALVAWFFVLELPLPSVARLPVVAALLLATGLLGGRLVPRQAFLFTALFAMRLMMVAWDKWQRGWPRGRFGDYALYFTNPALVVFPPYVTLIPFPESFARSFTPALDRERARRGLGHIGTGLLAQVGLWAFRQEIGSGQGWLGVRLVAYVVLVLGVARVAHVAYGLALLHGFVDERAPMRAPLLATDFVDMWSRFQVHQKDMQVAFFYAPVLIALRRANRYVVIVLATAATMLVGNVAVHFLVRYVYSLPWLETRVGPIFGFAAVEFAVLAATLCLQEWRRRKRRRAPRGVVGLFYTLVCWAATQTLTAVLFSW
ncbi:MAG TPA: hypothetical protein VGL81_17575 [Polyangiaceae bacterium]|jgi:hypothetical protein